MALPIDYDTPQRPPGAEGFRLIETMRWEHGAVQAVERHAARLRRSAAYFGFPFSEARFHTATEYAAEHAAAGPSPRRVRLTLGRGGGIRTQTQALEEGRQEAPLRLARAAVRAHTADPFFRHKTTWRRTYARAYRAAQASGNDEALLLNERGEVTEGTRTNLFVEMEGGCYTPPVRCGLLPGVGRAAWLAEGAEERVLTLEDVRAADTLWLVSGLRGRRRAVWAGDASAV